MRLTAEAIRDGLFALKTAYENNHVDFDISYKDYEYGTGQVATFVSVRTLLNDAIELIEEQIGVET